MYVCTYAAYNYSYTDVCNTQKHDLVFIVQKFLITSEPEVIS